MKRMIEKHNGITYIRIKKMHVYMVISVCAVIILGVFISLVNLPKEVMAKIPCLINTDKGDIQISDYRECDESIVSTNGQLQPEIIAGVYGTIYKNAGNLTIYGYCLNSSVQPLDSNATFTLYNKSNGTIYNAVPMTITATGRFKYENVTPTALGNYLVEFICTRNSDGVQAYAYEEIQIPEWLDELLGMNQTTLDINTTINSIQNDTNQSLEYIKLMLDYFNIKTYSYVNASSSAPSSAYKYNFWEITSQATDEYGMSLTDDDVYCEVETSFWSTANMTYKPYLGKFYYSNVLNQHGDLDWNVTCYEV